MKSFLYVLSVILVTSLGALATPADDFGKAQTAYNDGLYAEAVLIYENMISNGVNNTELHYNLANAYFKDGDLPEAVWHYRKAWYKAPRDPDIRANLHFALNAAGAVDPKHGLFYRVFTSLSTDEWIATAVGGYLLLTVLLLLALLVRRWRLAVLKLALLPVAVLGLAAGGWWHWRQFRNHPEGVVVKSGTTALYGPVEGSTAHYKVPLGALVRWQGAESKGWIEIAYDDTIGWIKKENVEMISP